MIEKLELLRYSLKKEFSGFPVNSCSLAAARVFRELGHEPVAGYVLTPLGVRKHSWNIAPDGDYEDLTLGQFMRDYGMNIPDILIMNPEEATANFGYIPDEEMTRNLRIAIGDL